MLRLVSDAVQLGMTMTGILGMSVRELFLLILMISLTVFLMCSILMIVVTHSSFDEF